MWGRVLFAQVRRGKVRRCELCVGYGVVRSGFLIRQREQLPLPQVKVDCRLLFHAYRQTAFPRHT